MIELRIRPTAAIMCMMLVGMMIGLAPAAAAPPPQDEPQAEAQRLVGQLGHPDYLVRQAAARRLAELGDSAADALAAGLKSPHAETRLHAERVLSVVQRDNFERGDRRLLGRRRRREAAPAAGLAAF